MVVFRDDTIRDSNKRITIYHCKRPANNAVTHTNPVAGLIWMPKEAVVDWLAVGALTEPVVVEGHHV